MMFCLMKRKVFLIFLTLTISSHVNSALQKRRVKAVYGQTLMYYLTTNYIANWKVTGFYDCVKKCIVEFYDDCTYIDYTTGSDDCYLFDTALVSLSYPNVPVFTKHRGSIVVKI
ncbi:Hypothetical predicted protein [Mytilus galloprovincialis]|nr:Hypothetical predicted protein [Mytilus galloprovincialis]